MSITHVTDHERELLARIELLRAALASICERVNSPRHVWVAYDVDKIARAALRADK